MTKPKVREMLDQIDTFLTTESIDDVRELWNVLTALRGPDVASDHKSKVYATMPIRRAAFPKVVAMHAEGIRFVGAAFLGDEPYVRPEADSDWHFQSHAVSAAHALGLDK